MPISGWQPHLYIYIRCIQICEFFATSSQTKFVLLIFHIITPFGDYPINLNF